MLQIILIAIAIIVIVLVAIIAIRPSDYRVMRSVTISAPASVVFAQVNELHKWEAWSPWDKMDSRLKKTFEGPSAGAGAGYSWVTR
jgi:hypothetical protein